MTRRDRLEILVAIALVAIAAFCHFALSEVTAFVAAAIALAAAFVIVRRAADRIPLGIIFKATSILLYAMAVIFIGQGVASLQEASVVPATFLDYVPTVPMLGVFPTLQTLGAQAALVMLAVASLFIPRSSPALEVSEVEPATVRVRGRLN